MIEKGPEQERLAAGIEQDAQIAAGERKAALEGIAQALGKPPQAVAAIVEKSGLDPSKLPGDDPKQQAAFEQLVRDVRQALGDEYVEVEALAAPLLDPAGPFGPTGCGGAKKARTQP